jgi:hypothetical protein
MEYYNPTLSTTEFLLNFTIRTVKNIDFINIGAGIAQSLCRLATGWTAGVKFPAGTRFFSSQQRLDRLWGPPGLLSNQYSGQFPLGLHLCLGQV